MCKTKVLMVGESLLRKGGVVSVQKIIIENMGDNIHITHIASLHGDFFLHKSLVFIKACITLFWLLLYDDFSVVHSHVSLGGSAFRQLFFIAISRLCSRPIILHSHGSEFHVFYEKLPNLLQYVLRKAFCQCDYFIVLSETWKEYYTQNLGIDTERILVMHNPVKIPKHVISPKNNGEVPVSFVSLGRIGKRKGTFDLLKALSLLPPSIKSLVTLTLAGDGMVTEIKEAARDLGLKNKVSVLGWIDAEQRDVLLKKSDVFILPSYNEGLPMAMLEAMSYSLAVITTPVGGVPDIIGDGRNGLLVNPGDISQLSLAMRKVIESSELRKLLGINARKSVEPLDVKKYCEGLTKLYVKLKAQVR